MMEFRHGFVTPDVDVVVFDRAPQALDHDVVHGSAHGGLALQVFGRCIHADFYSVGFKHSSEGLTGELASLI